MLEIRPFARPDRDQLRELARAHIAAAVPGGSVPSAALLTQLERPVGEPIIGPWVTDMATLVAVEPLGPRGTARAGHRHLARLPRR